MLLYNNATVRIYINTTNVIDIFNKVDSSISNNLNKIIISLCTDARGSSTSKDLQKKIMKLRRTFSINLLFVTTYFYYGFNLVIIILKRNT